MVQTTNQRKLTKKLFVWNFLDELGIFVDFLCFCYPKRWVETIKSKMLNSQRGAELIVGYQKASPTPPKKIETMHFGDGSATNHLDHSRSVSQ